jgi:hypothetical protein
MSALERAIELHNKFDFATFIGTPNPNPSTTSLEQETAKLNVTAKEISVEEEIRRTFYNLGGPKDINTNKKHAGPSS